MCIDGNFNTVDSIREIRFANDDEIRGWVEVMVFNATFDNIVVRLWLSVLLVEETGENHRPEASH